MTGLSILTSREGFCCIKTNSGNWLWAKGSGLESSFSCYRSAAHGHLARLAVDNLSAWQSLVGFDFVSSRGGSAVAGTRLCGSPGRAFPKEEMWTLLSPLRKSIYTPYPRACKYLDTTFCLITTVIKRLPICTHTRCFPFFLRLEPPLELRLSSVSIYCHNGISGISLGRQLAPRTKFTSNQTSRVGPASRVIEASLFGSRHGSRSCHGVHESSP